ncbi:MAG: RecX family transcriptional regulator [Solirubrobacteraceae bacterium]|nr:RecX family transcriptional regulator [Solirubrobacteraceae bacterium]
MASPSLDHGQRVQEALERAFRFIAKRERTVAQVSARLERDGISQRVITEVVAQMVSDGYLSDQRFAALYAEDRRVIDGWGNERIITNLREAGISSEIIESVVGSRDHADQVGDAIRVLDQRIGVKPSDERERERALGMLARRGYSLEIAYDAVRAFERS